MKIAFTGGGTGGHFYPIIAVAQKVNKIIDEEKIIGAKLYYISDSPYDKEALFENNLIFEEVKAGKMRTYFSIKNFFDFFKTAFGIIAGMFKIYSIYPDVVFGKGGYASFPTLLASRILRIPVVIHESDSSPGRVNKWAGKFAKKVAVSFIETSDYFPAKNTAWVGQPVRGEVAEKAKKEEALNYFHLESGLPVILILGGSQGAELINNIVLDALPILLKKYQVIHQVGVNNFKLVKKEADIVLEKDTNKERYLPFSFLSVLEMKMASGCADIVISRAGSTIFEIASWGIPSIIIPITNSNDNHQRKNAYSYARAGACSVIEEANMKDHILSAEVERIIADKTLYSHMAEGAKAFAKPEAATKIARELVNIALKHEE